MIYTIDNMVKSIALMLSGKWSAIPVYDSPTQQGVKFPCFFVFLMPSNLSDEVDDRAKRELNFDVVYVQARNAPNANAEIYSIADGLDTLLDYVQYTDGETTAPIHTHDRAYSIEDQELHYKFRMIARVSLPYTATPMQELEENDVEIKEA